MNYNIYMKTHDNKWMVVPFGKPFATFEDALIELKKQAKKVRVVRADGASTKVSIIPKRVC